MTTCLLPGKYTFEVYSGTGDGWDNGTFAVQYGIRTLHGRLTRGSTNIGLPVGSCRVLTQWPITSGEEAMARWDDRQVWPSEKTGVKLYFFLIIHLPSLVPHFGFFCEPIPQPPGVD